MRYISKLGRGRWPAPLAEANIFLLKKIRQILQTLCFFGLGRRAKTFYYFFYVKFCKHSVFWAAAAGRPLGRGQYLFTPKNTSKFANITFFRPRGRRAKTFYYIFYNKNYVDPGPIFVSATPEAPNSGNMNVNINSNIKSV